MLMIKYGNPCIDQKKVVAAWILRQTLACITNKRTCVKVANEGEPTVTTASKVVVRPERVQIEQIHHELHYTQYA